MDQHLACEQQSHNEALPLPIIISEAFVIGIVVREDGGRGEIEADRDQHRCPQPGEIHRHVLQRQPAVDPGRADVNENEESEQRRLRLQFLQRPSAHHMREPAEQFGQSKSEDEAVEGDEVTKAVHGGSLAVDQA